MDAENIAWITKLANEPRGFDSDIREVAVARSSSLNQRFAMMLILPVTMGPDVAIIAYPATTHQKLLLIFASILTHAPITITIDPTSIVFLHENRL